MPCFHIRKGILLDGAWNVFKDRILIQRAFSSESRTHKRESNLPFVTSYESLDVEFYSKMKILGPLNKKVSGTFDGIFDETSPSYYSASNFFINSALVKQFKAVPYMNDNAGWLSELLLNVALPQWKVSWWFVVVVDILVIFTLGANVTSSSLTSLYYFLKPDWNWNKP